ncbi:MotA/TolQ/ExbB proton channel family protein [Pseudobacteriovorax antillogorgiicola]|uniref:MotA/TolQ/ExbB proton channel family protein n=1 Tax=Pseudobacteriovorax antillogorgiicola TaxID=1513793 RepID=A0A1Y6BY18_9BACT|nr:MotA/TolQ/ExbB proton channel family protein [Pseudobacteriovorax antillogorgiicola]TCS53112.1 MotA/TolQ/ExbB proton channel family protein [Pseudobacteriovorax antillogorgiicola]SMF25580.1 MotA/TolQ/ExbB proton channel family protein [Pseudobacteriovorax antillogorgiicola]
MVKQSVYKVQSSSALFQIFISFALLAGVAIWQNGFLSDFLIGDRSTSLGKICNSLIIGVFLLGTLRIIALMITYGREERSVRNLYENLGLDSQNPFNNVDSESIIAKRFHIIQTLSNKNAELDHGALAAIVEAEESAKASFPKFICSILILMGMLGTILSLAIALLGASNLLESMTDIKNMGLVINGMSTALSTTMTGIVCYILFRFYLGKLLDVQSNLLYAVERVTALTLIPMFGRSQDAVVPKVLDLIENLDKLVKQMAKNQESMAGTQGELQGSIRSYTEQMSGMVEGINQINVNLHKGFRL